MNKHGSLSLFFCVIITALSLVFSSWFLAVRTRADELRLAQSMASQIEVSLASYDEGLYEAFGLFGYESSSLDRSVFYTSLPEHLHDCPIVLEPRQSVFDPVVLDRQMVRYMKAREPGIWLDWFAERFDTFSDMFSVRGKAAEGSLFPGDSMDTSAWNMPDDLETYTYLNHIEREVSLSDVCRKAFQSLSSALIRKTANRLFNLLFDELETDWLVKARQSYQQSSTEVSGLSNRGPVVGFLDGLPDLFNPRSMTRTADALDQLFDFSTPPIYEKLCVVDYILSAFTSQVEGQWTQGTWHAYETLDGMMVSDLKGERPCEAERVLTGFSDPEAARITVRFIITSIRSLIHMTAILTDETRLSSFRAAAATLAGAVAVISAGTVAVEPETITYLLVACQAVAKGMDEGRRLIEGQSIPFWPGKESIEFSLVYRDYLRLMLLSMPRSVLVERSAQIIQELYPGSHYTNLFVKTRYNHRTYALEGGYE
jgi:hypothetical protein